jgi:hypothetical protein
MSLFFQLSPSLSSCVFFIPIVFLSSSLPPSLLQNEEGFDQQSYNNHLSLYNIMICKRYPSKWQRMVEKTDHANVDPKLLSQKTNPKHSVMRHEE